MLCVFLLIPFHISTQQHKFLIPRENWKWANAKTMLKFKFSHSPCYRTPWEVKKHMARDFQSMEWNFPRATNCRRFFHAGIFHSLRITCRLKSFHSSTISWCSTVNVLRSERVKLLFITDYIPCHYCQTFLLRIILLKYTQTKKIMWRGIFKNKFTLWKWKKNTVTNIWKKKYQKFFASHTI